MESNKYSYKLIQKNKTYILTISVFGNDIKISVKSEGSTTELMRVFTIDTWKKIGSIFGSIKNATEAVQWIDNTLNTQKVKIVEDGILLKLVFFIIENRTKHLVEISLTGEEISNTKINTISSFNIGTITNTNVNTNITTTTTSNLEVNFNREIGLDPSKILKQTENGNTQEIIKSIRQEQQLRLSQVGKIITEPYNNIYLNQFTSSNVSPNLTVQFTDKKTEFNNTINTNHNHMSINNYSLPYITPADEIEPNMNKEIKIKTNENIKDDKLIKFEEDTNLLRNEYQEIQNKLNNLFYQVNLYKNQLESLKNENNSRELSTLKAENASMKQQQLSEFYNLKREVAQIKNLLNQVSEIKPLRKKEDELNGLQNQLKEIIQLKNQINQINQMNLERQQKEEILILKELENLKKQYEQEIRTLKGNKTSNIQENSELEKTQLISVKGDIFHNNNEIELIARKINKINKVNKKIILNFLYKATVDSDKAQAFHEKCDEAKSTLVLVETDKGKRFGGFTSCSWEGDCIDKKDENAFIFSLDKMKIYENIPGEDAIGCYPEYGPVFLGCQIRIYDNAFSKGGTTFEKGLNYNTEEDYELTGGDRIFNIKEIEVYEVIVQ